MSAIGEGEQSTISDVVRQIRPISSGDLHIHKFAGDWVDAVVHHLGLLRSAWDRDVEIGFFDSHPKLSYQISEKYQPFLFLYLLFRRPLSKRNFIDVLTEETYRGELQWFLCETGTEYLNERDKL